MRIEVVAGLEVRAEQEYKPRIRVIRRRSIGALPQRITNPGSRRADVCVRVMPVNSPRLENAVDVSVVPGPAYVIHDFVTTVFDQGVADFRGEGFEHFIPRGSFPLTFAARADSLQREEYALGIVNLIDCRRAFGAVASARPGMQRIAFELLDLTCVLIDVGEKSASRFAIKASGRHK